METTLVNAVFEGGGVRGISLAGAVRAAELACVRFHRVAGTSSGSIVAALVATGYTAVEMKEIIGSTPFRTFMQRAPIFNVGLVGPAVRMLLKKGLYSGDALEAWVAGLLAAKGVRVFGDLPPGKVRIIASDITNGKLLVLPDDIADYGLDPARFPVARAIRMSTSIPYFFDPVVLRQPLRPRKAYSKEILRAKFSYIVDGGLLSNFPLWLFEKDMLEGSPVPVVGFQMIGRSEVKQHRISGPITMFQAMFETMLGAHDERYIEEQKWLRTIRIPTLGVGTTQFDLKPEVSLSLYEAGLAAGQKFFSRWDRRTGKQRTELPGTFMK
ncbi:patatin-like phospholipase family protein [Cohnella candidum]|uniref:Patatin n=1 Tax=Cohnella candidum TaxID=2674991 RepID=A0A3G3JYB7_9BACL|nr:patatin-like phospholipase family protein [Cohnella candidum]AYQ72847.1 patatin [Cohnella candidum]